MAKFFKNIKVGIIEEVEDKGVIDMMTRHTETYVEVDDPAKKKAKAEAPKAEAKKTDAEAPKADAEAKK